VTITTLTTDFGALDWFVGAMKGAILGVDPRTCLVDITHEIPPGDVRAGAFALAASYASFPKGTVHVAVVDPGVGSSRSALAVKTAKYFFVGPDNGVLSMALARERVEAVHRLVNEDYFRHPVSYTFHGRDIFAPVAAHLGRGVSIRKLGPAQKGFVRLPWPRSRGSASGVEGEVLYVDRFGNAITNIEHTKLISGVDAEVEFGRNRVCPVCEYFQKVGHGKPVAVPGSSGFIEIAVNGGSAAKEFGLRPGIPVSLRKKKGRAAIPVAD
jgi:S-adenosyl-L-methionine hydrolase (adenosine-forming)